MLYNRSILCFTENMAKKSFKIPNQRRNPYCGNAKFCKGLCGCFLISHPELQENQICPIAKRCKFSAGCALTIAQKDCPVCHGLKTDYYYSVLGVQYTAKCVCNTCTRSGLIPIPLHITPDIFLIHSTSGLEQTISSNHIEYSSYIEKFRLLREFDASK